MLLPDELADSTSNPFTPDFGQAPLALVGRDALLADLLSGLSIGPTDPRFTTILLGPRGSGKTVVQGEIENRVESAGWLILDTDSNTPGLQDRIQQSIANARSVYEGAQRAAPDQGARSRLAGVTLGPFAWQREVLERVPPEWDLRYQLTALAEHAQRNATAVLLSIDELQGVDRIEMRRLAGDLQRIIKKQHLPLAFLGAGLSGMKHTLLADKRMTFFQRCARSEMPPLTQADALAGLKQTITDAEGSIDDDALLHAAAASGALPFRMQVLGHNAWNIARAPNKPIDLPSVRQAALLTDTILDERVNVPAWHDLGSVEQTYLHVVATSHVAVERASIARALKEHPRTLADTEDRLVSNGYITRSSGGQIILAELMPSRVIIASMDTISGYGNAAEPGSFAARRCNAYMPRANAQCVLREGHAGGHRSGHRNRR